MNDQPNDTDLLNNLLNNLELEISKLEESGLANDEAITNLMDNLLEDSNVDNKIIDTTIQEKSDNDQLKTTINDPKINEEETCDENDSDENDSDENNSNQVFTEDQCLMDAYDYLCNIDKEAIKFMESRNNLFDPVIMKHEFLRTKYYYTNILDCSDLNDALDSISHIIYDQKFNKSIEDID
nr:hypothetical protein [Megavirus caiporensis]